MTDRLNERLRQHDDLEEKLRELEVGVQTADIRLADRKSKLDPNDTQIEKLNEVEKELNDIDRETKRIRKDKDDTVSRIHNLLVRISKSDPDNCNLSELMELCQNCEENTDTLSDDIDASLKRLRALNDCLDSVLERIRAEKRQDALQNLRKAHDDLDELTRALDENKTSLNIISKETDNLNDEFIDAEKVRDIQSLNTKAISEEQRNKALTVKRDQHKVALNQQEKYLYVLNPESSTLEDYIAVNDAIEAVNGQILTSLRDARDLTAEVDHSKQTVR